MLETLHISNYALIDAVDIRFYPGLDIITGETGAGKSIMLGALSLLLGGRADTKAVRSADRKSVIEAVFAIEAYPHLRQVFAEADIDWDPQRCILRREIAPNGRSRAFVNDSPVPLSRLQEIAINLIDIHSQHNNQLLAQPGFQLQVIDTLAGNAERLREYGRRFDAFRSAVRQLKKTKARLERVRDDEQFTRYQLEQLDSARLQSGELEQLEKDREVLGNLTAVKSDLYDALQALSDGGSNAISLVDEAAGACDRLGAALDETDDIPGRLATIRIELADIAATLSETDAGLSADPRELEAAEERIDTLYSLLSRHKAETVDQLIERREELRARLEQLDDSDTTVADLEREARRALALAKESAAEITATRRRAAADFAAMLRERAMPLGMKKPSGGGARRSGRHLGHRHGSRGVYVCFQQKSASDACGRSGFGWRDLASDALRQGHHSRPYESAVDNLRRDRHRGVGRGGLAHRRYDGEYFPFAAGDSHHTSAAGGGARRPPLQGFQGGRRHLDPHTHSRARL